MAGLDPNIYFQQQPLDIFGNVQKGLAMRDTMNQKKIAEQDRLNQQAVQQAYQAGMVQNPDGTVTYDPKKVQGALGTLTGNPLAGKAMFDLNTTVQAKDFEQEKYKNLLKQQEVENLRAQQAQEADLAFKRAQTQKLNTEVNQLRLSPTAKLTEGQKSVDKDYAKDYNDFVGGGEVKAQDALEKLRSFRDKLASESNNFFQAGGGPISGSLPDMFRTQESISLRDNIMSAANSGLKATFGGQLSDGERKAAAAEYYNDKLDAGQNVKILDQKIKELENSLGVQKGKAQYYEGNRSSLAGFGANRKSQLTQSPSGSPSKQQQSKLPILSSSEIEW